MKKSISFEDFVVDLYRKDPALAGDVLNGFLASGVTEEFLLALLYVSKVFGGIKEVAKATGIHKKMYKTFSVKGNKKLKIVIHLADMMGMSLAFIPKRKITIYNHKICFSFLE